MTIAVILEGGTVSAVVSDDPNDIGKEVRVIDYDTDGADLDDLKIVPQADGSRAEALSHVEVIEDAVIDLAGIRAMTEEELEGMRT